MGAIDFETSRDFYVALGFKLNWDQGNLAELDMDGCRFLLQDYYNKDWCNNSMLHMDVEDTRAWYQKILKVLDEKSYGAARTKEPKLEDYGSLVTHFWDPSGVLWHLAEPQN